MPYIKSTMQGEFTFGLAKNYYFDYVLSTTTPTVYFLLTRYHIVSLIHDGKSMC